MVACAALGACDGEPAKGEVCGVKSGDLAISEIMAAPDSDSGAVEWIEIFNTTGGEVTLNRLVIELEGTSLKQHQVSGAAKLAPHGYFVMGEGSADHVDYVYDGIELTNSGGILRILCQGEVVDQLPYGEAGGAPVETATSSGFDGGLFPDEFLNDDTDYWCPAVETYDGTNYGTPGSQNPSCGVATCTEAAGERDVAQPAPGDVVLSEVFADAGTEGGDTNKEWIELFGAGSQAVDLNALKVVVTNTGNGSSDTYVIESVACVPLQPGGYLVLGSSSDTALNGGVAVDVVLPGLSLTNDAELSIQLLRGTVVVDTAVIPGSKPGRSIRLDEGLASSLGNDLAGSFCEAPDTQSGLFAERGTPGAPNGLCGVLTCRDGETVRAVEPPDVGGLLVSELMAEPSTSNDAAREWIELYVAAGAPVDLNGLSIRNSKPGTTTTQAQSFNSESCLRVQPGTYVVLARPEDPAFPSNLPADAVVSGLTFYNDAALEIELSRLGVVFDIANVPASVSGKAQGVPTHEPVTNDVATAFCLSEVVGLFEEVGTPGQANICGPACVQGGAARTVVAPNPGDLVITEVMANPDGTDNGRDWIEIYMAGGSAVDLNGLGIVNVSPAATTKGWTVEADTCIRFEPGGYAVLGGQNIASLGITPLATFGTASDALFFSSFTGTATLTLDMGGTPIDAVGYPSQSNDKSYQLDDDVLTTAGNDAGLWCQAAAADPSYTCGTGSCTGSPGLPNPTCDPE